MGMETLIRLNSQTAGRDKIARLLQYLSRVLWHRLQLSRKDGVDGFKNLEFQLSTFRKLLRFGRCFDVLYSALPLFHHYDPTVKFTLIISKICNSLFLLADHFLWLGRSDLCKVDTEKWSRLCNKYWLYSITMNLVRDAYEISTILKSKRRTILPAGGFRSVKDFVCTGSKAFLCVRQNRAVMVDTLKNGCDFFIPLNALGHVKLSPGMIGWLGVVSSAAGLIAMIEPLAKLSPS